MQLLSNKSLTQLKDWFSILRSQLDIWKERSRQRKALTQLSPYLLKDIGVSRSDAINEVQKPFWKP